MMLLIAGSMVLRSILPSVLTGTVTLRWRWKSSKSGAILWLLLSRHDHKNARANCEQSYGFLRFGCATFRPFGRVLGTGAPLAGCIKKTPKVVPQVWPPAGPEGRSSGFPFVVQARRRRKGRPMSVLGACGSQRRLRSVSANIVLERTADRSGASGRRNATDTNHAKPTTASSNVSNANSSECELHPLRIIGTGYTNCN
jgi:hypothetical protein